MILVSLSAFNALLWCRFPRPVSTPLLHHASQITFPDIRRDYLSQPFQLHIFLTADCDSSPIHALDFDHMAGDRYAINTCRNTFRSSLKRLKRVDYESDSVAVTIAASCSDPQRRKQLTSDLDKLEWPLGPRHLLVGPNTTTTSLLAAWHPEKGGREYVFALEASTKVSVLLYRYLRASVNATVESTEGPSVFGVSLLPWWKDAAGRE